MLSATTPPLEFGPSSFKVSSTKYFPELDGIQRTWPCMEELAPEFKKGGNFKDPFMLSHGIYYVSLSLSLSLSISLSLSLSLGLFQSNCSMKL